MLPSPHQSSASHPVLGCLSRDAWFSPSSCGCVHASACKCACVTCVVCAHMPGVCVHWVCRGCVWCVYWVVGVCGLYWVCVCVRVCTCTCMWCTCVCVACAYSKGQMVLAQTGKISTPNKKLMTRFYALPYGHCETKASYLVWNAVRRYPYTLQVHNWGE